MSKPDMDTKIGNNSSGQKPYKLLQKRLRKYIAEQR